MLRFANERGLVPLFHEEPDPLGGNAGSARLVGRRPRAVKAARPRLHAAAALLDGIGGLGWSVIGFVGGAIFWHFIGFWGFVSEVVLAGGPPPTGQVVIVADAGSPRPALSHWTRYGVQVADASAPPCTLLSLDRRTGVTSARPCDGDHALLPADSFQGREDRAAADVDTRGRSGP